MGLNEKFFKTVAVPSTGGDDFAPLTYAGTGSGSKSVTGLGFQPDLVWGRSLDGTVGNILFDSIRGINKQISTDNSSAQVTRSSTAYIFDSDGFTVTTAGNLNNANDFVAWSWLASTSQTNNAGSNGATIASTIRKNVAKGFSIITYEGTGSSGSYAHGLSSAPELVFTKNIDWGIPDWFAWHSDLNANEFLRLSTAVGKATASSVFGTAPTSTLLYQGGDSGVSRSGNTQITYAFHSLVNYQQISTYTWGQSSYTAGSMVSGLSFKPGFVMIKRLDGSGNWFMFDKLRGNGAQRYAAYADDNAPQSTDGYQSIGFDDSGFSAIQSSDGHTTGSDGLNKNGVEYLYFAISEDA
jgi:hypothetical protein|tara:strand:+ start:224 stop:1282 length:1059 start_codon:yes stop_codon:yes gene_type:complete